MVENLYFQMSFQDWQQEIMNGLLEIPLAALALAQFKY